MSGYTPDLEAYIEFKVQSGAFSSRDDLTAEAIRVYREIERQHESLKQDVAVALEQISKGEAKPLDVRAFKERLLKELDEEGIPR